MTLLKELSEAFGPSGYESEVSEIIADSMKKAGFYVKYDSLGNVICKKAGAGKTLMLSAFFDEPGFIVTDAYPDGTLSVREAGGTLGDGAKRVRFESGRIGLLKKENGKLKVDAGEKSKEEALKSFPIGSYAVFDSPYYSSGGFAVGKALSSRAAAAALIKAAEELSAECSLYVVFTSQHLSGSRGAAAAAEIGADEVLAVGSVSGRGGVYLSAMDKKCIADEAVKEALLEIDPELKISVTDTVDSDAGALSRLGAKAGAILLGVGEKGAETESVSLSDIEKAALIIKKFAERK